MGIIYGLGAALFWGVGDFAITMLARYVGSARSLLYIQSFSLLSWIVLILVFPHQTVGGLNVWLLAALAGVFHVAGLATTYRAFEVGTLSFVSPIASSFAIVTAVMFVIAGDNPPILAMAGIVLLTLGIVVVTKSTKDDGPVTLRGVPEAIVSALSFGIMFWLLYAYVKEPLGFVYPLIVLKVMATGFASGYVARTPREPSAEIPKVGKLALIAFAAAAMDTLAWVCYLFGSRDKHAAVVTALASLFSVTTIVLAGLFLKERLNRMQWIGVGVVLAGILLVSLPTPTTSEPSGTQAVALVGK